MNYAADSHSGLAAEERLTFPLSFAEERLWFIDKLEPGLSVYNVPEAFRLKGQLDVMSLERSINEIVRRHEILRTTFSEVDGRPVQVVAPELQVTLAIEDLSHFPASGREQEARRLASDDANRHFDLEHGPLVRVRLLRLGSDEHVFFINMHHIVSEGGWSMGVLLRELSVLYRCFTSGEPSPLRELEIQFGDYAAWQREWLTDSIQDNLVSYWKNRLQGAPALLELPLDRPRPPAQSYRGSRESLLLPAALKTALQRLSVGENVTLFTTLLAAFKALLFRYTGQEDLSVGIPVAGRNSLQTHDLIGFFINTLVLRTDLSGDPSFRQLLQRVRIIASEAQAHDETPFELIVEALKPERTLAYTPLFQVMFAYQNTPREPFELTGLTVSPFDFDIRTSMFDLRLFLWEQPDGILLTLEYCTDLFERETIQRLLGYFQTLLQGAVANPDIALSALPLMTEKERQTVVVDWNNTARQYPALCLHAIFEQQVARDPHHAALIFGSQKLTYRELNVRANRLAHHLRQQGVQNGSLVGLYLERSLEMVVAIYGVIKAGGAYVPYDPEMPAARLSSMLEDSKPAIVLTLSRLATNLSSSGAQVIALDSGWKAIETQPDSNPAIPLNGHDPIYAIYTSGSTGLPKAAVNVHEAVTNRILWMQDQYQLTANDRVLQKTPYTFDVSVWEFFWPLVTGATLVIAEPGGHRDPAYLAGLIEKTRVTTIHFVPSMLREFLNSGNAERCRTLRRVICSGEALSVDLQNAFFDCLPAELHNLYGPTEAAVDVTYWECRRDTSRATVPIGKPIANVKMHVLDKHLQPLPIGFPGELHIGGIALAQGYLNRPELTAAKFIHDPLSDRVGARLYKTGDLARYLPDGNIEYLGRIDNQVKLRGFRIELGDIEANIMAYPGIRGCAVMVREDQPGDKRLVAYILQGEAGFDIEQLRAHLRGSLPDYMVPSAFIPLEAFPQTSSGKLDRKALPAPSFSRSKERELIAPRDNFEARLVRIWEDVLKVNPIGVQDNYFDLGGYSILAVRLFSEIRKAFGIELPLATLYSAPTVESLAAVLAKNGEGALWSSLVPIRRAGSKPPFYFVSGVGGGVLVFRDLALYLGDDQPVYALQPKRPGENERYPTSIEEMASQYVEDVLAQQPAGPYYIGGYSLGGFIAFEMAQQLTRAGHQIAFLGIFDANAPLRIADEKAAFAPRRNTGSRLARLKSIVQSNTVGEFVKQKIASKRMWVNEKLARSLNRPMPAELQTLEGSQAFAGLNYVGRPYSGSLIVFRSAERPPDEPWSYQLGWENVVKGEVEVHEIQGDHLTIYSGANIGTLGAKLKSCLRRAQSHNQAIEQPLDNVETSATEPALR